MSGVIVQTELERSVGNKNNVSTNFHTWKDSNSSEESLQPPNSTCHDAGLLVSLLNFLVLLRGSTACIMVQGGRWSNYLA